MKRIRAAGLLLALTLLTCLPARAEAPKLLGYVAWWMQEDWRRTNLAAFERLAFFDLAAGADGGIIDRRGWPERWQPFISETKKAGVGVDLTLTLADPAVFAALFASPPATAKLLTELEGLAAGDGVDGIQLDIEIYEARLAPPATVAAYRRFVDELARRLRQQTPARRLSVFLPVGGEIDLYDPPTLSLAQGIVVQGYDAHWEGSATAGPVAPLDGPEAVTWGKALAQAARLGVPRDRVRLSFPLYGYEWPVAAGEARAKTRGKGVQTSFGPVPVEWLPAVRVNTRDRVLRHGAQHDPVSGSAYYRFQDNGGWFVGWFEDWWSLESKLEWVRREGVGGLALFPLGYDDGHLVDALLARRQRPGPVIAAPPATPPIELSAPAIVQPPVPPQETGVTAVTPLPASPTH